MTRFAAAAFASLFASAVAAGLPIDSGEACRAHTLELEAREPDAETPRLADDPACRSFVEAFSERSASPAPTTSEALLDAMALYDDAVRGGAAPRVDPARIAAILDEIRQVHEKPPESAWQRFVRWLRDALAADSDSDAALPDWIRLLQKIPEGALRAIWWSLFALMAASLAWIVVRELRAAGVFARRERVARGSAATAVTADPDVRTHTLDEIGALPAHLQAGALLRASIAHLRRIRRLPSDDSLTNGELRARLATDDAGERSLFAEIVRNAEAQVYGGSPPGAERMRALLEAAGRTGLAA